MEQAVETFREEAAERLVELEQALLALERAPGDGDLVGSVFRALHTIKGSAGMFGFDDLAGFTHELETIFDHVRGGRLGVSGDLIGLALRGVDLVKAMLADTETWDRDEQERLVTALRAQLASRRTYLIRFRPNRDLLLDGTNPLLLLEELRALGPCEVLADTAAIPSLDQLDAESCYVGWEIRLTTQRDLNAIRDVFIFVEGRCQLQIEEIDEVDQEIEPKIEAGLPSTALSPNLTASSLRVSAEKIDHLVDVVGELVIAQARLTQIASLHNDPELSSVAEEVARLSADLRDHTLSVRMVAIGTTFSRFSRLVRDLSSELDKDIALVTEGAETELDKSVIESLSDPLVHLIRNSCDHGIENRAARLAAGKPAQGTLRLSARHAGRDVVVELSDDGRGLDPASIRAKAIERGLIAADAQPSPQEIADLIFLPGFSTATTVSAVSGRGVGMDVVRRAITALRGTVTIASQPGGGTTVRISLPLTLAIIEGLLVAVGEDKFVLPMSLVEECVELTRRDVAAAAGNRLIPVRGELVPYLRLREVFAVEGEPPPIEQIAIVTMGDSRYGFAVDHVVGQLQTVIKTLGDVYRGVEGISGATILGDGKVALIVDAPALMKAPSTPAPAAQLQ
jgi:two-component system chemotaxis sensor kinase CheA